MYYRTMDKKIETTRLRNEFPRKDIDPKLKRKSKTDKIIDESKNFIKSKTKYLGFAFTFTQNSNEMVEHHYNSKKKESEPNLIIDTKNLKDDRLEEEKLVTPVDIQPELSTNEKEVKIKEDEIELKETKIEEIEENL